MRSLSHELVHHTQNCNGQFDEVGENEMGEGYAQNNDHLRNMESEAYEMGNLCFRDWEDSIKSTIYFEHLNKGVNKTMSTKDWKNKEIKTLLTEQWGFSFNLDHLNEEIGPGGTLEPGAKEKDKPTEREEEGNVTKEEVELEEEEGSKWKRGKHEFKRRGKSAEHPVGHKAGEVPGPGGHEHYKTGETEETEETNEVKLSEDSGAEEGRHYSDNAMSDEDHIKAIRHHLEALEGDRDYDEDHESLEEGENGDCGDGDELEEGGLADRPENATRMPKDRGRRANEAQIRAMVREALKKAIAAKTSQDK